MEKETFSHLSYFFLCLNFTLFNANSSKLIQSLKATHVRAHFICGLRAADQIKRYD